AGERTAGARRGSRTVRPLPFRVSRCPHGRIHQKRRGTRGNRSVMSKNLVVRFAGEGGQGVVGGAELMAQAAAQGGYHVLTFSTFPSQIKGGPAWGQARISSEPILTPGDYLDVLVCQNQYAYYTNLPDLREGGLV